MKKKGQKIQGEQNRRFGHGKYGDSKEIIYDGVDNNDDDEAEVFLLSKSTFSLSSDYCREVA